MDGTREPSAWSRRASGTAVLLFIFSSAGLWLATLLAWEFGRPEFVALLLALAAFAPAAWLAARLIARPVWALRVDADRDSIAESVRVAVQDRSATEVAPGSVSENPIFARCEVVFRLDAPRCVIGVERSGADPWTTVLLVSGSADRGASREIRDAIARAVGRPSSNDPDM